MFELPVRGRRRLQEVSPIDFRFPQTGLLAEGEPPVRLLRGMGGGVVMGGSSDYFQYCRSCRKKFLSYAGGKPICLSCWTRANPFVVVSLGGNVAGGIMDSPVVPDMVETFLPDEPVDLFPLADALLRSEVADDR